MDGMTQPMAIPQTIADAIEAVVQERVVAALATEKECRLAFTVKLEGDAYQRGYGQALADLEDAWGKAMRGLWGGREEGSGAVVVPFPQRPVAVPAVPPGLTEWDAMLVQQGVLLPADVQPPVIEPSPTNLYGWPDDALAIVARQWPRYVTEREIQNEVEAVVLETVPAWKIRAQAQVMKLVRPLMPRLLKGEEKVSVTWHQAAMLARAYSLEFSGDMLPLNMAREADGRAACLLLQPHGPTPEDIAAYGPATL
jgi:hypothetical protein